MYAWLLCINRAYFVSAYWLDAQEGEGEGEGGRTRGIRDLKHWSDRTFFAELPATNGLLVGSSDQQRCPRLVGGGCVCNWHELARVHLKSERLSDRQTDRSGCEGQTSLQKLLQIPKVFLNILPVF
jgi:hypothetical protein